MRKFTLTYVLIILIGTVYAQNEVIVGWTFPGNSAVADTGIAVNLDKEISTMGGTSEIQFKNGFDTKAAQATGWDEGMDSKSWVVSFSTEGYSDLTISSKQSSGGNEPGPKNFKIQYSIDMGTIWTDVPGSDIIVENDWETSFVENLELPDDCENMSELLIRWVMSTNEASGAGGDVLETGKSKIDEIFIKGVLINSVKKHLNFNISIKPNPTTDYIQIHTDFEIDNLCLIDLSGRIIIEKINLKSTGKVDVSEVPTGIYMLSLVNHQKNILVTRKVAIH